MKQQALGSCVIVLDEKSKKVLVGKRSGDVYKAGYFGFPGGHIEPGELMVETARRELEEETGLLAESLEYVGVVKEWQGEWFFIHFGFVCNNWSGEVGNLEDKCEGWEWHGLDDLPKPMLPGHVACLELWQSGKQMLEL